MSIDWNSFRVNSQSADGIRIEFENLCRHLFANEFLSSNNYNRYLHANPNNPGIETEPVYDETNNQWIGFQAKYFEAKVDYGQIEKSAREAVNHYAGKIDAIYLFCNKPLTTSSLNKTTDILNKASIQLKLITDNAILDLVIEKYSYLGSYYFGNHSISNEWIREHTESIFEQFGERYNRKFNVETSCSRELSFFVCDKSAVDYINDKKKELLKKIEQIYFSYNNDHRYLKALEEAVKELPDVDIDTIIYAAEWEDKLVDAVEAFLNKYQEKLSQLNTKVQSYIDDAFGAGGDKSRQQDAMKKYQELSQQISILQELYDLPKIASLTDREKQLLYGKILCVEGRAGSGKSHLLANETRHLIEDDRFALLLNAGVYFTDDPISDQIAKNLSLDYPLEKLIDILETHAEKTNKIVPVFIDALNETWNKKLWKVGLPKIIKLIEKHKLIKLVFSYRSEYEKLLLSESVLQRKNSRDILSIYHRGFEDNSITAIKEFLNYYSIPFTPASFLSYELTNPLFLTLYCRTYNGEDVSLLQLYERITESVNAGIFKSLGNTLKIIGYEESDNIIQPLIDEIVANMADSESRFITRNELCNLGYWEKFKLPAHIIISQLVNEHMLRETFFEDEERLTFEYDQMYDYYYAKAIVNSISDKDKLRNYLSIKVLGIEAGTLNNNWNVDIFVNASALYAEKYNEECIDIIDVLNDDDMFEVFSRYIDSFQWRNSKYISEATIKEFLKKYPCAPEDLWHMLIGNSLKKSHPLNADFLHKFLASYDMNKRDYLWTVFINELTWDESERIIQIIKMYDRGETLSDIEEKQVELLLTVFGWLLTTSNRWLRDYTSKAMVEILKNHFPLCLTVLEKFKNVNDPYVIERLYGIIFGACSKRTEIDKEVFSHLAEVVYRTVFEQDIVYPDILLRDYARLIIELFLAENPSYEGCIDPDKIKPPYNSEPIPHIEDKKYLEKDYEGGMWWIVHSMCFEGMGMYGDFGRYIFQSALRHFEVDEREVFNYAIFFIVNELGYREDYFDKFDTHCNRYDRHQTAKVERIGKKYQWIAMHNILSRVADHCRMVDAWSYPSRESVCFEGAWDLYVRDFDPTLNKNFLICPNAPSFDAIRDHIISSKEDNKAVDLTNDDACDLWLEKSEPFFDGIKNLFIMTDNNRHEWISLTKFLDTGRDRLDEDKLYSWSWIYGYFVDSEILDAFSKAFERGDDLIEGGANSHHETYSVFNREYPWSPSCNSFDESAWITVSLPSEEKKTVIESYKMPDMDAYRVLLDEQGHVSDAESINELSFLDGGENGGDKELSVPFKDVYYEREIKDNIGPILYSTSRLIWEGQYDATNESTVSWEVPCFEIVKTLDLKQMSYDGYFYDRDIRLAAFDTSLIQNVGGVVIRRDLLDEFLEKKRLNLIWIIQGEKSIHGSEWTIAKMSKWQGLYKYNAGGVSGDIRFQGLMP